MKLYLLLAFLVELTCVYGASITTQSAAQTTPTCKVGVCPKQSDLVLQVCFRQCKDDSVCKGVRKCCKTGCDPGYQCQLPDDKPGSCPPIQTMNGTTCNPSVSCKSDSKCPEEQKCCPNQCNSSCCQDPV